MEKLLFALYIFLAIVVYFIARRYLKTSTLSTLFPLMILDTIPVSKFPMSNTDMYFYDFFLPFFILLSIPKLSTLHFNNFLKYTGILYFLLPILCFLISSVTYPDESMSQYVYIYRKITVFSLVLFSTINYKKFDINELLSVVKLYWIFYCIIGIGHYLGFYYADIISEEMINTDFEEVNVFDKQWELDGFMGLNRGAIGVICSALIANSTVVVLFNQIKKNRFIDYLTIISSISILLLSGSRTGILASIISIFVLFVYNLTKRKSVNTRLIIVVSFFLFYLIKIISDSSLAERYDLENSNESKNSRVEVQYQVFSNSFEDVQSFLFGSVSRPFSDLKNILSHPHSDYFQVLWDYGWVGLILYLSFLFFLFTKLFSYSKIGQNSIISFFIASIISGISIGNLMISTSRLMSFVLLSILLYNMSYLKIKSDGN